MRAIPGSIMRQVVGIGAPLSRFGGITAASAAALRRALELLSEPPKTERRQRLMSVAQIAKHVDAPADQVERWARTGLLGHVAPRQGGRFDRAGIERAEVVAYLRRAGVAEKTIKAAAEENRLALLVVDASLMQGGRFTAVEAARKANLSFELAEQIWRALGLPPPDPAEERFSRNEVAALRIINALGGAYSDEAIIETARVMGRSMARLASAEVETLRREMVQPFRDAGMSEMEIAWRLASVVDLLSPALATLMDAAHRWHLEMAIRSESIGRLEESGEGLPGQTTLSVAFADMVGFTAASDQLSAGEVGAIAGGFMRVAERTLPDYGARIVKGIGDAVMFTAPDPVTVGAASVALIGACAAERKPELPRVRAGAAHGPVLPRYADYFGRTVNIASRLCVQAPADRALLLKPEPAPPASAWEKARVDVVHHRRLRLRGISAKVEALELGSRGSD